MACFPHGGPWLMPTALQACGGSARLCDRSGCGSSRGCQDAVGHSRHCCLTCSLLGQGPPPPAPLRPPPLQPGPGVRLSYRTWRAGRPPGPRDSWPSSQGHSCDSCLFPGAGRSPLLPVALGCLRWPGCCLHLGRRACRESGGWRPPSQQIGPSPRADLFLETPGERGSRQKGNSRS